MRLATPAPCYLWLRTHATYEKALRLFFPSLMTTMRPGAPSSSLSPGGALTTASGTTFRGDGDGASFAVEKEVELPDVACSSAPSSSEEEFCGATIHL